MLLDQRSEETLSKIDHLKNIWLEAKTERKEIERMKHRVQEMRELLERRLEVIQKHELVQRARLQSEKEELEKMEAELKRSNQTLNREWDRDKRKLEEKDKELEMIKAEMLKQIERLQVGMESKSQSQLMTDIGMQTSEEDLGHERSTKRVREEDLSEIILLERSWREETTGDFDRSNLEFRGQGHAEGGALGTKTQVRSGGALEGLPEVLRRIWRLCCCFCCSRCCGVREEEEDENL